MTETTDLAGSVPERLAGSVPERLAGSVPERSEGARRVTPFAPDLLQSTEHHLCPGCGHPVAWRLLVEVLDELALVDRSIGVVGHGCYTHIITTADVEFLQCLHGRAPAVATGVKRMLPDRVIYTLQGDGDMVSEGLAEVLHVAARGESITCLMLDNGVFGDTGGQMTATTTVGQRTKTDLDGRAPGAYGYPIAVADIVATFPGVAYVARGAVDKPNAIARTKRYLRAAFESQMRGEGFSLVEILTMCPTGWAVPTEQGPDYQREQRGAAVALGELKPRPPA
jgi:2-oxoglutarate ferredoxin oxidoreductase subunit beta